MRLMGLGAGLDSIRVYRGRAALSICSIAVAVMAIVGTKSIIAGVDASVRATFVRIGSSVVFIRARVEGETLSLEERQRRRLLSYHEVDVIRRECRSIASIAPFERAVVDVGRGDEAVEKARLYAVTDAYGTVHELAVERGRFLVSDDVLRARRVCVLGARVAEVLFKDADPIGGRVVVEGQHFEVVGVIGATVGSLDATLDLRVYVPLGSLARTPDWAATLEADVQPGPDTPPATTISEIEDTLRRERRLGFLQEDTFALRADDALLELYHDVTGGIYAVALGLASIALLVGGVGVMVVMLMSVTERTREIGVRRAVGARVGDLRLQFLVEAVALTSAGGLIGVLGGWLIAIVASALFHVPAAVVPSSVLLGVGVSSAVGLTFGVYPALSAAHRDPVEALRHE